MSLLVIISSPSGGGKDSVINALLKRFPNSTRFVTTTSRPPRPGNVEGIDYYFISPEEFERKMTAGDFIEYNNYAGNWYGTQKKHLQEAEAQFAIVFSQVEVNGKHNFDKAGIAHISIYLLPENLEVLRKRIEKRGGITADIITERLKIAEREMQESTDYDYRIVNYEGKLDETVDNIAKIINFELTKTTSLDKNS